MTAPAADDVRGQLAAHRLTTPRQCLCGERQDGEWSDNWHAEHVADALLPVVSRIADQRAVEARRDEQRHTTELLAELLRLTYDSQLDSYPNRDAQRESERVADAFRDLLSRGARELNQRRSAARLAPPAEPKEQR